MGAAHLMIEQANKSIADVSARLDAKGRDDLAADLVRAGEIGTIKATLESIQAEVRRLAALSEKVIRLEVGHEQIKDVTGKHDVNKALSEASKREERELEEKRIASEERRARIQFWSAIAAVALPGLISMILHLVGATTPRDQPTHEERPAVQTQSN